MPLNAIAVTTLMAALHASVLTAHAAVAASTTSTAPAPTMTTTTAAAPATTLQRTTTTTSTTTTLPAAPDCPYVQLVGGVTWTCAIREDGALDCWGIDFHLHGDERPIPGRYVDLFVRDLRFCGRRIDGSFACWQSAPNAEPLPKDVTGIVLGYIHGCGLRQDGTVRCWGRWSDASDDLPPGHFVELSAGSRFSCGRRPDGTVQCWGNGELGRTLAPSGAFVAIETRYNTTCGLRPNGQPECWGANDYGQASPPEDSFEQLAMSYMYGCGLRADGSARCWGSVPTNEMPNEKFTQLATTLDEICGLRADGTVLCWGRPSSGRSRPSPSQCESSVCGDGIVGSNIMEACDDGDTASRGDYCDPYCALTRCGKPTYGDGRPSTTDALFILLAGLGIHHCALQACDTDGSGSIAVSDALRVLRHSVGHFVEYSCPSQ